MAEQIASRAIIAARAEQDVLAFLLSGQRPLCPYPQGSAAQLEYDASFDRYWHAHAAPEEVEGGA